ncbi:MAG: hypothetical protein ACI4O7_10910 [Aristaeellaceae bacterium]
MVIDVLLNPAAAKAGDIEQQAEYESQAQREACVPEQRPEPPALRVTRTV